MLQPAAIQHPKYRRSWIGRLMLLALVVQWVGLWGWSLWYDLWVGLELPGICLHLQSRRQQFLVELFYGQDCKSIDVQCFNELTILSFDPVRDWKGYFAGDGDSFLTPFVELDLGSIQMGGPYLLLIVLTLLAYFAIGWFRSWRFNRWVKRTGA